MLKSGWYQYVAGRRNCHNLLGGRESVIDVGSGPGEEELDSCDELEVWTSHGPSAWVGAVEEEKSALEISSKQLVSLPASVSTSGCRQWFGMHGRKAQL